MSTEVDKPILVADMTRIATESKRAFTRTYSVDQYGNLSVSVKLHYSRLFPVVTYCGQPDDNYFIQTIEATDLTAEETSDEEGCLVKANLYRYNLDGKFMALVKTISVEVYDTYLKKAYFERDEKSRYFFNFFEIMHNGMIMTAGRKNLIGIIANGECIVTSKFKPNDNPNVEFHVIPADIYYTSYVNETRKHRYVPALGSGFKHEALLLRGWSKGNSDVFYLYGKKNKPKPERDWDYEWQDDPKAVVPMANLIDIDSKYGYIAYKKDGQTFVASGMYIINIQKGVDYSKKRLPKSLREKCAQIALTL